VRVGDRSMFDQYEFAELAMLFNFEVTRESAVL
jgi:hypothetical protein